MDKEDRNALAVMLTMLVAFGVGFLWLDAKLAAVGVAIENNGKALAEVRMDLKDIRTDLRAIRTDIRAMRADIREMRTGIAGTLSEVG